MYVYLLFEFHEKIYLFQVVAWWVIFKQHCQKPREKPRDEASRPSKLPRLTASPSSCSQIVAECLASAEAKEVFWCHLRHTFMSYIRTYIYIYIYIHINIYIYECLSICFIHVLLCFWFPFAFWPLRLQCDITIIMHLFIFIQNHTLTSFKIQFKRMFKFSFAFWYFSGWWFQIFFFPPLLGEMIQFDPCFSDGLTPPPSFLFFK